MKTKKLCLLMLLAASMSANLWCPGMGEGEEGDTTNPFDAPTSRPRTQEELEYILEQQRNSTVAALKEPNIVIGTTGVAGVGGSKALVDVQTQITTVLKPASSARNQTMPEIHQEVQSRVATIISELQGVEAGLKTINFTSPKSPDVMQLMKTWGKQIDDLQTQITVMRDLGVKIPTDLNTTLRSMSASYTKQQKAIDNYTDNTLLVTAGLDPKLTDPDFLSGMFKNAQGQVKTGEYSLFKTIMMKLFGFGKPKITADQTATIASINKACDKLNIALDSKDPKLQQAAQNLSMALIAKYNELPTAVQKILIDPKTPGGFRALAPRAFKNKVDAWVEQAGDIGGASPETATKFADVIQKAGDALKSLLLVKPGDKIDKQTLTSFQKTVSDIVVYTRAFGDANVDASHQAAQVLKVIEDVLTLQISTFKRLPSSAVKTAIGKSLRDTVPIFNTAARKNSLETEGISTYF